MMWCARIGVSFALLSVLGCNRNVSRSVPPRPAFERSFRHGEMTVIMTAAETNIPVAGQVVLAVSVQAPSAAETAFPSMDALDDSLTVQASRDGILPSSDDGQHIKRREWVLAPSVPGSVGIPSLVIVCGADRVITDPLNIHVDSVLPPDLHDLEIRDIAGPLAAISRPRNRLLPRLLAVLAVVLAVPTSMALYLTGRRSPVEPAPHEAAFQALKHLPATGADRVHALNRLLREYIERRFHLRMLGKTAQEIMPELEQSGLLVQAPWLSDFFNQGDQVRFSNVVHPGFLNEAERFVIGYIETTRTQEDL